jgi:deoxyadenosine/deoxycytidine kinase
MGNNQTNQCKIVSIEGNIGSGKSTLLENLRNQYKDNPQVVFLKEPVEEWEKIKDKDGKTMLSKFYENQEKYSFSFQMMAYISRLKILRDTIKQYADKDITIITERSLFTDKYVFAKMLFDQGKIEDVCYQIYLNWFDEFAQDFPITHTVYVCTQPQICYERVHLRARKGEEVIPLSYLEDCDTYHDKFISNIKSEVLILNGNYDIYENKTIVDEWLNDINEFIS